MTTRKVTALKILLLLAAITSGVSAYAQEAPLLGVTLDSTFVSKYLWRGYDWLDDRAAFQPSVNVDVAETGLSLNVWGSFPFNSDYNDSNELDYTAAYGTTLFEDDPYALDLSANYTYYDYPNVNSDGADVMEVGVGVGLPNLIPIGPSCLVPSLFVAYDWPYDSDEGPEEGWFTIFGLGYDVPIPALIPDQEKQFLILSADVTYSDGPFGWDPGFSHSTFGISTSFEYAGFALTPNVNYQWSFEDTVNDESEFWAGINLSYSF